MQEPSTIPRFDAKANAMRIIADRQRLLDGRTLTLLPLASFWFSTNAMAIGGRGGEGAHFGGEDAGFGRYGRRGDADALHDAAGNRLPGAVTSQEEGGRIAGHEYDRDGIDLSEQKIHPDEYPVVSGGHLTGWQSLSDRQASRAVWRDAHRVRTLFILVGLVVLGVVVSAFAFS